MGSSDTQQQILEAARDLCLLHGISGFSMRAVAARVGISATAIYRHYDSKETLVSAVAQTGMECFARYLWRGLDGTTPLDRLRRTGLGYLQFGLEQSSYYRIIFMTQTADLGFEKLPKENVQRVSPTFQFLVDRVRDCISAGCFYKDDPEGVSATIWSLSHGLVSLYLTGHFDGTLTQEGFIDLYQRSTDRLYGGLKQTTAILTLFLTSQLTTLTTVHNYISHTIGAKTMANIIAGRMCAQIEGDFCVFLIGARINQWWNIPAWYPIMKAMPKMISELVKRPELGLLGYQSWFGRTSIMLQYWRSTKHLFRYAHLRDAEHLPAWRAFHQRRRSPAVGLWHESYTITASNYNSLYMDMPSFGLAKATDCIPAGSAANTSRPVSLGSTNAIPVVSRQRSSSALKLG